MERRHKGLSGTREVGRVERENQKRVLVMKVSEIVGFVSKHEKVSFLGDPHKEVSGFASLVSANSDELSFCSYKADKAIGAIESSNAGVIICHSAFDLSKNFILVDNPRFWFIKVVREFFLPRSPPTIHPTAVINECVVVGENVRIGPYCSIGFDGFGFDRDDSGVYERFPHVGKVIIGDNVEIGANVCIDRGTLSDTVIGEGTKIDNLVHIAHNVRTGKNCCIVALSCIGGSVQLGDNVYVGIGASIRNQKKIGDNVMIGMGAVVVNDCLESGTYIGIPARRMKE